MRQLTGGTLVSGRGFSSKDYFLQLEVDGFDFPSTIEPGVRLAGIAFVSPPSMVFESRVGKMILNDVLDFLEGHHEALGIVQPIPKLFKVCHSI